MKLSRLALLIGLSLITAVAFAAAAFSPAFAFVVDAAVAYAPAVALSLGIIALPTMAAWHIWNMARQGVSEPVFAPLQSRFPAPQTGTPELTAFA